MKAWRSWLMVISLGVLCCLLTTCSRSKQKHERSEYSSWALRQKLTAENQPTVSTSPTDSRPDDDLPPGDSAPRPDLVVNQEGSMSRHEALLAGLTIFVLAIFVGFEVVTKVPPTLHTPLMSGSNAISGITLVGAVIMAGLGLDKSASYIGLIAVVLATINVVGGFLVTHRMLSMFRKR